MLPFQLLLFFISHFYATLLFKIKNCRCGYFVLFCSERKAEFKTSCCTIATWFFSSKLSDQAQIRSCCFLCVYVRGLRLDSSGPSYLVWYVVAKWPSCLTLPWIVVRQPEGEHECMPSKALLQFLLQHSRTYHRQFLHALANTNRFRLFPWWPFRRTVGRGRGWSYPSLYLPWSCEMCLERQRWQSWGWRLEKQKEGHALKCLFWLKWAGRMEFMKESCSVAGGQITEA